MVESRALGLDTSILLRLLVGEPPSQAESARQLLRTEAAAGRVCQVNDLVITETYFALHTHLGVPKKEAVVTLLEFLDSSLVQATGVARQVLRAAASSGSKPGFVDRLIHAQYAPASLVTFEKASIRLPGTVVLG